MEPGLNFPRQGPQREIRLVVAGAGGRMGCSLVRAVVETAGCTLAGALAPEGSRHLGRDAGVLAGLPAIGVTVLDDPLPVLAQADGLIDFTTPEASVAFAGLAAQARLVHVVGTTGFSEADGRAIEAAARHAVIVRSGNMSLGVNLLAGLVRRAAAALGEGWDIEIVEMHHRMKVDAPSGTALLLGEAAARGRGSNLAERTATAREGHTGPRRGGDIGFASLRGGTVVGDHQVVFAGAGERIEIAHRAEDRAIFARGAVAAALWGQGRTPGLYGMADVLGLEG